MANRTVKDAHTVKGTNPQYLVEKIIRLDKSDQFLVLFITSTFSHKKNSLVASLIVPFSFSIFI